MFGFKKEIKFRVLDLYNGKILEGKDIPEFKGNLPEIIRQFSGTTYQLSEYSGMTDMKHIEMYDDDKVIVYRYDRGGKLVKIGKGQVSVGVSSVVDFMENGELERCYLDIRNRNFEFEVVGNHFDNWEDINY